MENEDPEDNFWSRRRWLGRMAFPFLIIALFLGYTAYQGARTHELSQSRAILYLVTAMLAFVLFVVGTRARHR